MIYGRAWSGIECILSMPKYRAGSNIFLVVHGYKPIVIYTTQCYLLYMITRDNKVKTYHIWKRALSETRVELTKQFAAKYPGIIEANEEWSDLLCLRVETLKTIV